MKEDDTAKLATKIEQLCARCEHLYRENKTLQGENKQLRARCEKAKQQLSDLLVALPEYE